MALRNPQALIGTLVRAGVLCIDGVAARTCIAHGLPETPDSFSFVPLAGRTQTACYVGVGVESWDATSIVFVVSNTATATACPVYLKVEVTHSSIE